MVKLPEEFISTTRRTMGDERFERYMQSFEEEPPVSIRLNPRKVESGQWSVEGGEPVPWCSHGYYLKQRPQFTMDPLLHAGCYYVQEAASMFLDEVLRQFSIFHFQFSIDLCAAPGGKSTLLRSALPEDCMLTSNEPNAKRCQVLAENVEKWGYDNHIVTNNYPHDFVKARQRYDLILCDVPCSGEGMFRKDAATISEWSPAQVEKCWRLQRAIVSDAWQCLNDGGIIIYSTCTFNTRENEENVRWFMEHLGAEVVPVNGVKPEWNITGSLLEGFTEPVYRFIPGITRSEGLFMCVMRKSSSLSTESLDSLTPNPSPSGEGSEYTQGRNGHKNKRKKKDVNSEILKVITPLSSRRGVGGEAFGGEATAELTYQQALQYLRHEALVLPPETPRGELTVTFMGQALGRVKNIGPRANNLYPKEWRIKTTHTPDNYEPVIIKH